MTDHANTLLPQFENATVPAWGTTGDGWGSNVIYKFHFDIDEIDDLLSDTLTTSDVLKFWDIPAGTEIRKVMMVVRTAATATNCTVAVGDDSSTAGFMAATALSAANATGVSAPTSDVYAIVGGKLYSGTAGASSDTLDVTFGTAAPTGAVFDLYVFCSIITDL